ncbi:MAG: hypothetical protein ACLUSP_00180 [Christensenellales bacterium]
MPADDIAVGLLLTHSIVAPYRPIAHGRNRSLVTLSATGESESRWASGPAFIAASTASSSLP